MLKLRFVALRLLRCDQPFLLLQEKKTAALHVPPCLMHVHNPEGTSLRLLLPVADQHSEGDGTV